MLHLVVPCLFGLESVVSKELTRLGYPDQDVENGRITFKGDTEAICRANIWIRTGARVMIKTGSFTAVSFEELFEQTKSIDWSQWLSIDSEFPIHVDCINSQLMSTSDCQAIVKKAVVESLKKKYSVNWFEETGPKYRINVSIIKDFVTLAIDTSGVSLHKRGYRTLNSIAPLSESLASGLIQISRWRKDRALCDPFCGSGTIPIEAAMIGKNIAPGLTRSFEAEAWPNIKNTFWEKAKQEARDLIMSNEKLIINGTDIDARVLELARFHAAQAGVDKDIHFQRMDVKDLSSSHSYGFIICNPPYGERLMEMKDAENLYRVMGKTFNKLDTWSKYVLTSHEGFEDLYGQRANKKRKLYNGMIKCNYYQFYGTKPKREKIQ